MRKILAISLLATLAVPSFGHALIQNSPSIGININFSVPSTNEVPLDTHVENYCVVCYCEIGYGGGTLPGGICADTLAGAYEKCEREGLEAFSKWINAHPDGDWLEGYATHLLKFKCWVTADMG